MKSNFFAIRISAFLIAAAAIAAGARKMALGAISDASPDVVASVLSKTIWWMALGIGLAGVLIILWIAGSLKIEMQRFIQNVSEIASGKLTQRVRDNWLTTGLAANINQIVSQEKRVICEVAAVAQKNSILAEQLSKNIELNESTSQAVADTISHIAENASEQAEKSNQARTASQEMAEYAAQISTDAVDTLATAESMTKAAETSRITIGKLIEGMVHTAKSSKDTAEEIQALEEEARRIDTIVAAVTDISQRTNLLALNAAIEAARAGDAGKGFAVVADEVRKLAEQSSQSAGEINRLLDGIVTRINEISERAIISSEQVSSDVASADESRNALQTVNEAIQNTYEAITRIRETSEKSSASAEKVDRSMDDINGSIQQTAAGAEEVSASAEEQSASMQELSNMASTLNALSGEVTSYLENFISGVKIGESEKKLVSVGYALLKETVEKLNHQNIAIDKASENLRSICNQHKEYEYIGILNEKGDMVSANVPINGVQNYAHRPYFKEAMKGSSYCSDPYISNVSFNYCLALAVPYKDSRGSIVGVIMADLCIER